MLLLENGSSKNGYFLILNTQNNIIKSPIIKLDINFSLKCYYKLKINKYLVRSFFIINNNIDIILLFYNVYIIKYRRNFSNKRLQYLYDNS